MQNARTSASASASHPAQSIARVYIDTHTALLSHSSYIHQPRHTASSPPPPTTTPERRAWIGGRAGSARGRWRRMRRRRPAGGGGGRWRRPLRMRRLRLPRWRTAGSAPRGCSISRGRSAAAGSAWRAAAAAAAEGGSTRTCSSARSWTGAWR
ncbi:hypothetical protein U9M48_038442 [Paspalum notatum var. saurae]|uniref:Uncharacterized protein n=1 Tax=Paspalum notatum var. saurae TaxID=547442 RepID=A0AAQ3UHZ6_PASNO